MDYDVCLLGDEFVVVPEVVVQDKELLMLMLMLVLMSVLEDEDELQEVVGAVECQEVVEGQVVELVLLMKKKLLLKILLSKLLWIQELLVEQHRWWAEVADEIVALEEMCFFEEVVDRPGCWTLQ